MVISIREAVLEDTPAIVELIRELAASMGEHSPIAEKYVAKYFAFSSGSILLAESQGSIQGLLSYSIRPDLYHAANTCLIEELIVRNTARGQGIAGRLMDKLMTRLASHQCAEVSVSTLTNNQAAIRFYRKYGFAEGALYLERHFFEQVKTK